MNNGSSHQPGTSPFETCPLCEKAWETRNDFLDDPDLAIVGYQAHFEELTEGLFLFDHSCGTTMALKAGDLLDLYHGQIFETRLTGTDECPGYCIRGYELRSCPAKCDCAFAREVIQIIKAWPKIDWYPTR